MKIKGFALLSLSLVLVGCTSPSSEVAFSVHETNREWYIEGKFEIIESWSNSRKKVSEVRDLETGVHYYLYEGGYGDILTPVYESDGTIRVTDR